MLPLSGLVACEAKVAADDVQLNTCKYIHMHTAYGKIRHWPNDLRGVKHCLVRAHTQMLRVPGFMYMRRLVQVPSY